MTKRQSKKDTSKKLKDLDPKAKGKGVKGGNPIKHLSRDTNRILGRDVPRAVDDVADAIRDTVNPR